MTKQVKYTSNQMVNGKVVTATKTFDLIESTTKTQAKGLLNQYEGLLEMPHSIHTGDFITHDPIDLDE